MLDRSGGFLFFGGSTGRVGTWDGANFRNYDNTGTGTGPRSNATVVGATSVEDMILLGTVVVFYGRSTARIGSWDGTNFKNSDGTGAGTGPFTAITQYIADGRFATSYQINGTPVMVFSSLFAYSYVTVGNRYATLYSDGAVASASVSRLLQGSSLDGYLYVYRYENGQYLMMVTGNQTNKVFLVNTLVSATTPSRAVFNGRYAMPQVSGGFTRHIVIETPRIDTVPAIDTMRALSLVGYTNFVSFPGTQVYPENDSVNVNAINISGIGPVIGFNYADVTYRTTASVTDIFELYLPNPTPTAVKFNRILQSNTETNINGYGKLNNMVGLSTTKPFEFRNIFINGIQSAISVAMIDGLPTDALGVLITGVGEWDDTYTQMIQDDDKILYRFNGKFCIVKIGTAIPDFFDKLGTDLYKLNTIHPSNLYSDDDETLYQSSMDYNGRAFFTSTAAPGVGVNVASVITSRFSNSIDVGNKLVLINPLAAANIEVFGNRLPSAYGVAPPYSVDTYIDDLYSFSTIDSGEVVLPDPPSPIYVESDIVPVPIGADYGIGVAVVLGKTLILNKDFDGYMGGNDIEGEYVGFNLFAQTYLFDGDTIFLANIQQNFLESLERLAPANGLVYVASSPTAIYFLSSFDNSIYVFDGGRNVTKYKKFSTEDQITQGVFSVKDNTLLLDAGTGLFYIRDGIITRNEKKITQTDLRLYETRNGLRMNNDIAEWQYTFYPLSGSAVVAVAVQTAFFGLKKLGVSTFAEIIVTIYSDPGVFVSVLVTHYGYDQDGEFTPQPEQFNVTPANFNSRGYAFLRFVPTKQEGLANSIGISATNKIQIMGIGGSFNVSDVAAIAAAKTK
jgi:hypothetical protein